MLPLHSVVAYAWAILVTWNFNLLPSFLLFAVGWILLATNEQVQRNPSHWKQSRGYFGLLRALVLSSVSPETIGSNHRLEEINEFDRKEKEAAEKRKKQKEEEAKQDVELEGIQAQLEEGEVDIASGKTGLLERVTVNPLKPVLYPIQKELQKAVTMLRISKTVVLWEETYYAFWIVTVAFFASALVAFVPWGFLGRWTLRIVAWVILGPWMALVDKYYLKPKLEPSEDADEAIKNRLRARYEEILEGATQQRIRNEAALKLKAMKRFCFGKFLVNVPRFKEDLYLDAPLPLSDAKPFTTGEGKPVNIVEKKFGQNLRGHMVPMREVQAAEAEKADAAHPKKKPLFPRLRRRVRGKADDEAEKTPLLRGDESDYQAVGGSD